MEHHDAVLPATSDEVVSLLDAAFPNKCPDMSWTDRKVWFEAGKRAVVDYLIELMRRRDDTILEI